MHSGIARGDLVKEMLLTLKIEKGCQIKSKRRQSTNNRQPQSAKKNENGVSQAIRFPSLFRKRYVEEPSSIERMRKQDSQWNCLALSDFKMSFRQKESIGATTYKALHIPSGKVCFVKDQPQPASHRLSVLMKKIQSLCQKLPEGVVQYYGCAIQQRRLITIVQYMSEGSLSDFITVNKCPSFIRRCFQKVITIINRLESQNINAANIKLSNVLLNSSGQVKLTDVICLDHSASQVDQFHHMVREADQIINNLANQKMPHLDTYEQVLNWYFPLL